MFLTARDDLRDTFGVLLDKIHCRGTTRFSMERRGIYLQPEEKAIIALSLPFSLSRRPLSYPRLVKPDTLVNERNRFRCRSAIEPIVLGETSFGKLLLGSVPEFNFCRGRKWMSEIYFI